MSVIQIPGSTGKNFDEDFESTETASNEDSSISNASEEENDDDNEDENDATESGHNSETETFLSDPGSAPPPDVRLESAMKAFERFKKFKKIDKAMRELVKCTALTLLVDGPKHWRYAESYTNLAQGYIDLKGPAYGQQTEQHAEFARSLLINAKSAITTEADKVEYLKIIINTHLILARAKGLLKKFAEGETVINKAITTVSELSKLPSTDEEYLTETNIKLHCCAAKIASRNEKHAVAMSHYETALGIAQRYYGDDAPELIPLYQSIGQAEQAKGKHANHERAVQEYLNAHEIAVKVYPENSLEVAESERALAIAYSKSGQPEAEISAESHLNGALATYISVYGPSHATVCQVQRDLACLYIRTSREMEGITLTQKNVKLESTVYGDYSEEVLQSYKLMASTYLSLEQLEDALKLFEKCFSIEEFVYGKSSKRARDTKTIIDTIAASPALAGKQSQSELKNRPRFNNLTKPNKSNVFNHT